MRAAIAGAILFCEISGGFAQTVESVTFTNREGRVFENVRLEKFSADAVLWRGKGLAAGQIKLVDLPADIQQRLGAPAAAGSSVSNGAQAACPAVSSADTFLARYKDLRFGVGSEWTVERSTKPDPNRVSWNITLNPKNFHLTTHGRPSSEAADLTFTHGEQADAQQAFDKFIALESTAALREDDSFERIIANYRDPDWPAAFAPRYRKFTFRWQKEPDPPISYTSSLTILSGDTIVVLGKSDVVQYRKLMDQIPQLKDELVQKIQNREKTTAKAK